MAFLCKLVFKINNSNMGLFDLNDFFYDGSKKFSIKKADTKIKDIYQSDEDYESILSEFRQKIDEIQGKMYAHNRHGLLIIIQAFDAAGKDSTIKAVFTGINPAGLYVKSFKRPSDTELDHDFMWRTNQAMPERGMITVFNRSYYEEVLVVKVHPEIVTNYQKIPVELTDNMEKLWKNRYADIVNLEDYLTHNGIGVLKIFLNVSKKVQGQREIDRILDPTKNWKFQDGDVKERTFWHQYALAYEEAINETATKKSPWYVVPADDKKNMRLIVSQIVLEKMKSFGVEYPISTPERATELQNFVKIIEDQDAGL
jgi:PPK2 family polyphosphate:nucleotide phosphotransferase